jgi:hypothetical protein
MDKLGFDGLGLASMATVLMTGIEPPADTPTFPSRWDALGAGLNERCRAGEALDSVACALAGVGPIGDTPRESRGGRLEGFALEERTFPAPGAEDERAPFGGLEPRPD